MVKSTPQDVRGVEQRQIWMRYISVPFAKSGPLYLTILAFGIVLAYVAACIVLVLTLLLFWDSPRQAPSYLAMIIWPLAFLGPIVWIKLYMRFRGRPHGKRQKDRVRRLGELAATPQFEVRLPHRAVELALYRRGRCALHKLKDLQWFLSGQIVLIPKSFASGGAKSGPLEVGFEPISLLATGEEVHELVSLATISEPIVEPTPMRHRNLRALTLTTSAWGALLFGIGCFIYIAAIGSRWEKMIWGGIILASFSSSAITSVLLRRHWWLIPGGLVFREDAAWRKGVRVSVFRPRDSALLVDWRSNQGCVIQNGVCGKFTFSDEMATVIPAGWLSTARSPTDAEIHSLFGC